MPLFWFEFTKRLISVYHFGKYFRNGDKIASDLSLLNENGFFRLVIQRKGFIYQCTQNLFYANKIEKQSRSCALFCFSISTDFKKFLCFYCLFVFDVCRQFFRLIWMIWMILMKLYRELSRCGPKKHIPTSNFRKILKNCLKLGDLKTVCSFFK